ncbi:uncharacterized protein LOC141875922 isoform X1 [Acropora palmata]|uniref:uncharacterized protein LOC141875922 isoform X1 n=1 Tax=Acropora palmata TaxID=6131 RepID=UPI003DA06B36
MHLFAIFMCSAKSMEPSMGVELTRGLTGALDLHNKGKGQSIKYSVGNIIMDGDTTTISHIHQNVSDQISVWSDIGHAKKALHGHLLRISSSHKALSKTVIDYLVKCFGYVLTQNKGNPEGIRKGCKVIPNHAFGDHSSCGSWCQHKKNAESYRHQSLPHGKDLEGEDLKADLLQVFELFASYADKLAPMGSTQPNESFNNLVSVHAPKRLHFSGSASLRGRVAFAVATKNSGKSTICKINEANNLSPGSVTVKFNKNREREYRKRKKRETTRAYKRKRIVRKKARNSETGQAELLEGTTYQSGVQFSTDQPDLASIPTPYYAPTSTPLCTSDIQNSTYVVFDLETSNIGISTCSSPWHTKVHVFLSCVCVFLLLLC